MEARYLLYFKIVNEFSCKVPRHFQRLLLNESLKYESTVRLRLFQVFNLSLYGKKQTRDQPLSSSGNVSILLKVHGDTTLQLDIEAMTLTSIAERRGTT